MLPLTKRPYISAYAPRGITVSGPPSSLSQLRIFEGFENLKSTSVPIYGPYHSSCLSSKADIEYILEGLACNIATHPSRVPIISSTGTAVQGGDFGTLLKTAVEQILLYLIRWNSVIDGLHTWLRGSTPAEEAPMAFSVVSIGSN